MIVNMLEASTSNLTESTVEWLNNETLVVYPKATYGFFLAVPSEEDGEGFDHEWPEDLKTLVQFARDRRCEWVMIDRDVEPLRELPTYEW